MTDTSLWATFSVADHLRRRPFVADVLLYDRLVVPVPDGDDETKRWRDLKRDPDRQHKLLEIAGELAIPIPWSIERSRLWASQYAAAQQAGADEAAVRDDVAKAVTFDANNIGAARHASSTQPPIAAGAPDPDDPAYMVTRLVLQDEFGSRKDRALLARVPLIEEVETVVAYSSYRGFSKERGIVHPRDDAPGGQPVFTFEWSFFVPSSSKRSDADLLRQAVDLAHADEIRTWRAAVQRWRRDWFLRGTSDDAALADLEAMIADYRRAARRLKIEVRSRWGLAVAGAAAGALAVAFPPAGIAAAVLGLGSLVPAQQIPKELEAAAMFHEARKRFA